MRLAISRLTIEKDRLEVGPEGRSSQGKMSKIEAKGAITQEKKAKRTNGSTFTRVYARGGGGLGGWGGFTSLMLLCALHKLVIEHVLLFTALLAHALRYYSVAPLPWIRRPSQWL